MTPRTSRAWKGHDFLNTCPNWASEVLIDIYMKSKCEWSSCLMKEKFKQQSYANLKLEGSLGIISIIKAWEDK